MTWANHHSSSRDSFISVLLRLHIFLFPSPPLWSLFLNHLCRLLFSLNSKFWCFPASVLNSLFLVSFFPYKFTLGGISLIPSAQIFLSSECVYNHPIPISKYCVLSWTPDFLPETCPWPSLLSHPIRLVHPVLLLEAWESFSSSSSKSPSSNFYPVYPGNVSPAHLLVPMFKMPLSLLWTSEIASLLLSAFPFSPHPV